MSAQASTRAQPAPAQPQRPPLSSTPSPPPSTQPAEPQAGPPPTQGYLYQLIYRQLVDDGLADVAATLAHRKQINPSVPVPVNALAAVVEAQAQRLTQAEPPANGTDDATVGDTSSLYRRSFPPYVSPFISTFRTAVTCSAFHSTNDWTLIACGSDDRTVKLIDVSLIDGKARVDHDACIRATLYDHNDTVTDLAFHHYEPFIATASADYTIRFYDLSSLASSSASQSSYRRPLHVLMDHVPVRCIDFHPSGDYLLSGGESPIVRLYDTVTMQCYYSDNSPSSTHYHTRAINDLSFNQHGSAYVSAGQDGSMIVFDSTTMKPINVYAKCHNGAEVTSAIFHIDNFTLLSSGNDSRVIEWETRMHRQLHSYIGAQHTYRPVPACYDSSGEFVISGDENTAMVHVWDRHADKSEAVKRLSGHTKALRACSALYGMDDEVISTGEGGVFCTGGDDGRLRVWSIVSEESRERAQ